MLAYDERSGVPYDVTHRLGEETAIAVEERNAASGRVLEGSTAIKNSLAINGIAVVPGNVWVAYASGTLGTATRFTRDSLTPHRPPDGQLIGSNGITVASTPGVLWVDDVPAAKLTCADPMTGKQRDSMRASRLSGATVGLDSEVYHVSGPILQQIIPGAACLG